ncbi:MAG: NUDIX domain-containing protein [Spirochaetales bacterium]|nr:NUDIX domain-containing protein [Candidatus Physcosoma equi]
MKTIDKVAYLHFQDGKVLSTLSKGKDKFYFPGGKREGNESDLETLTREIKEELSVDIIPETAKLYGIFSAQAHGKAEGVLVQMTCYTAEFTGILAPDNEIEKIVWLGYSDRMDSSPVDQLIFEDLHKKGLVD